MKQKEKLKIGYKIKEEPKEQCSLGSFLETVLFSCEAQGGFFQARRTYHIRGLLSS